MDPEASAGRSAQFRTFQAELNVSLTPALNLARKKPLNVRALAGWRHGEMGLQGPTLEGKKALRLLHGSGAGCRD